MARESIATRPAFFTMPSTAVLSSSFHDEQDTEVAIEKGLALARAWPDARFMRTAGLGHRRLLRDPEVIAAAVNFLADRVSFPRPPGNQSSSLPRPAPLY